MNLNDPGAGRSGACGVAARESGGVVPGVDTGERSSCEEEGDTEFLQDIMMNEYGRKQDNFLMQMLLDEAMRRGKRERLRRQVLIMVLDHVVSTLPASN
jgi:hypothetical protein